MSGMLFIAKINKTEKLSNIVSCNGLKNRAWHKHYSGCCIQETLLDKLFSREPH